MQVTNTSVCGHPQIEWCHDCKGTICSNHLLKTGFVHDGYEGIPSLKHTHTL